jgi:hypothetical protein
VATGEILTVIQSVQAQYAVLFAQALTINFAVIVATYYFLHRTPWGFRAAVFMAYLVGMLAVVGQMLQQANFKRLALRALASLPADQRIGMPQGLLDLHGGWLFRGTALLQNASLWLLVVVVAYMLLRWQPQDDGREPSGGHCSAD